MQASHLFIIDPVESLSPQLDSSLRMMLALSQLGHLIQICEPKDLSIEYGQTPSLKVARVARVHGIEFDKTADFNRLSWQIGLPQTKDLSDFAAIHMRKDPPFDLDYITTTWLIDQLPKATRVYNQPEALRSCNEKLLIADFPEAVAPLLVSADVESFMKFVLHFKDVVLKPLNLYGGRGILRLNLALNSVDEIKKTLEVETSQGHSLRLAQPFNREVEAGEVRVFTAFGKPLAWCLKKPKTGQFLANTRAGATLHAMNPSELLVSRITRIAQTLAARGIAFAGFDVIGTLVSEINITSPRLLVAPGENPEPIYQAFARLVEDDLRAFGVKF